MRILGLVFVAAGALAVVQAVSPAVRAQEEGGGTMVRVGPDGVDVDVQVEGDRAEALRERRERRRIIPPGFRERGPVAVSRYWIGLGGGPVPAEMRAQLDIDPGEGILVRTVAPDGPAAEAGVQQYDILLRANGEPIDDLRELAEEVGEQGEMKGRITLELLRRGQRETLWVAPVERPADAVMPRRERGERLGRRGGDGFFGGGLEGLFGPDGLRFNGDGLEDFAEMAPQMAMGVSVTVRRQAEGPALVTVTRGDQTWEFDEGDEEALAALPADVRPMVERMLNQDGRVAGEDFDAFNLDVPGFQMQLQGEEIAGRMRAMQERMRAMIQQQFGEPGAAAPRMEAEPPIQLDEAPAFNAEGGEAEIEVEAETDGEPVEIEIPAAQ